MVMDMLGRVRLALSMAVIGCDGSYNARPWAGMALHMVRGLLFVLQQPVCGCFCALRGGLHNWICIGMSLLLAAIRRAVVCTAAQCSGCGLERCLQMHWQAQYGSQAGFSLDGSVKARSVAPGL